MNVVTTENGTPPAISLDLDGTTKSAGFVSGSGSNALVFRYVVESSVRAPSGIGMSSPLLLHDGTIRDAANNNAERTFELPELSEVTVNDNVAPTVTSVTISSRNYPTGAHLDVTVHWNERVNVVTTANGTPPKITVDIEGTDRDAVYDSSLSGNRALVFRYTIVEADKDINGIEVDSPIVLNDGTISDVAGNNATLTFTAPSNLSQAIVNVTLGEYKGSKLFEGVYLAGYSKFAWVDVNDDNRLDLVIGGTDGKLKYYQATATSFEEKMGSDNPFNDIDVGDHSAPAFADLDTDDDLELVIGEVESGTLKYYDLVGSDTDNDGTDDTWTWTEKTGSDNPFNGIDLGWHVKIAPTFANLDTDSDLELIIGHHDGTIKYYDLVGSDTDNDGTDDTWTWTERTGGANPFSGIDVGDHSVPTFANLDTDDDGLELVIGAHDGTLKYYDLVGTTWTEVTDTNNPFNGIDVGRNSAPVFVHLDTDNDLELVIGEEQGKLHYYNKVGNAWTEESTVSHNPFHGIVGYIGANSVFVNLDDDDDLELVIGETEGYLKYYDLVGGTWTEVTGTANPFHSIRVGSDAVPTFGNLDDDDDLELLISEYYPANSLYYYDFVSATNTWVERTGSDNPARIFYVGEHAYISLVDVDNDGALEVLYGAAWGQIAYYELDGTNTGLFSANTYPSPTLANLDDDDELELVFGDIEGEISYYDLVGNTWTEREGSSNPFDGIHVGDYVSLTFANLDDDNDLEIVMGSRIEGLIYGDLYGEDWVLYK